jgi:hypothetical protein
VTVAGHNDAVRQDASRAGVCVVRIETQGSGVLITLRTNHDIEQVSTERVCTVADVGAAVQVVRKFLTTFAGRSQAERTKQTE